MKRSLRRIRANYYYVRRPLREFLPSLLLLIALLFVCGWSFYTLYQPPPNEKLSFVHALHVTFFLFFAQTDLPSFPEHWLLQVFYFILPPLGLVVILDGIARFGYHLLRRDENQGEWMRAMAKTFN